MKLVWNALYKLEKRTKSRQSFLGALCVVLLLICVGIFVRPALTTTKNVTCGLEEHTHSETCYEDAEKSVLNCGQQEHVHSVECYPAVEQTVSGNEAVYSVSGNNVAGEIIQYSLYSSVRATDNISWSLKVDQSGGYILRIEGTGEIPENFFAENAQLQEIKTVIRKMEIGAEITAIGTSAFRDFDNLEEVIFDENSQLETIGGAAFSGCDKLAAVNFEDTQLKTIEFLDGDGHKPSGGAFFQTALVNITLPASLEVLGPAAFFECESLENVYFEQNCNLKSLGGGCFRYCDELRSIQFENCTQPNIELVQYPGSPLYYSNGAVLQRCPKLESLTIPSGFSGSMHYFAKECTSLKTVTFQPNDKITDLTGAFSDCTALEEIDLSPLSMPEDINGSLTETFANDTALKQVTMPAQYSRELGPSTFSGCTALEWENINFGSMMGRIESIGTGTFRGTAVENVDFSGFTALTTIKSYAFADCVQLQSVILPQNLTSIEEKAFAGDFFLKNVKLNSDALDTLGIDVFENVPLDGKLVVGTQVDILSGNLLASLAGHSETILFEGPQTLTISDCPGGNGQAAPFNALSGQFYVDEKGVLYQLSGNAASVAYCPPEVTEYTVPAQLTVDAVAYTVTGVGSNAFGRADNLSTITFTAPEQIVLSANAFAECSTLGRVNNVTTVNEAKALFGDATAANVFYNTGLGGSQIALNNEGVKVTYPIVLQDNSSTLKATVTTPGGYRAMDVNVYRYMTGETATLNIAVDTATAQDAGKKIRVYFVVEKEECTFGYNVGKNYVIDGVNCSLQRANEDGVYYFEMDAPSTGATILIPIECKYPSPTSNGGKVQVWSAILSKELAENIGNDVIERTSNTQYYEMEWYTEPNTFTVSKDSQNGVEAYVGEGAAIFLRNLSYQIAVNRNERVGGVSESIGKDLVQEADFADVLMLPQGVFWRDEVLQAIQNNQWQYSYVDQIGSVYVTIAGEPVLLCTLSGVNGTLKEMYPTIYEGNKIQINWRIQNNSKVQEIAIPQAVLNFGDKVLMLDMGQAGDVTQVSIDNQASVTMHYTYSAETRTASDSATAVLQVGKGSFSLRKEQTKAAAYWGEELEYTITVENPSAFTYTEKPLAQVLDPLPSAAYLKVEEMERLLNADNGDRTSGKYLEIQIENALFCTPIVVQEVVTVDGTTTTSTSMQDTGAVSMYNGEGTNQSILGTGTITLTWEDGELHLKTDFNNRNVTIGNGKDYASLQEALDAIGFVVDSATTYKLYWRFPENEQGLAGGEKLVFRIYANAKDTFHMSASEAHMDYRTEHWQAASDVNNMAYAHSVYTTNYGSQNRITASNADARSVNIAREMKLHSMVSKDGIRLIDEFQVEDNDVLKYSLTFRHLGTGSYEMLPLVNRIFGTQALLVEYEDNQARPWASGLSPETISAVETEGGPEIANQYYVLDTPGTYDGVWIGGFYADKVIVEQIQGGGLETRVYWYFEDLPEGNYSRNIEYRTLVSREKTNTSALAFDVGNYAYLNDLPGHRLYVGLFGKGFRQRFDKSILSAKGSKPAEDVLVPENYRQIAEGQEVVYRLEISNSGIGDTIQNSEFYDILPLTHGKFEWRKDDNVKLSYVCEGESITLPSDWYIETVQSTDEDGATYAEQRIRWSSPLVYSGTGSVYIYVTLTYPEEDTWEQYIEANAGDVLQNTLSIYGLESEVFHELVEPGKARLQKGVFRIVTGEYLKSERIDEVRGTGDRVHYMNTTTREYYVIYYVTLYNGGNTRLYLTELQDRLPKGFKMVSLEANAALRNVDSPVEQSINTVKTMSAGSFYTITDEPKYEDTPFPVDLEPGSESVKWLYAKVSRMGDTLLADGSRLVKFEFGGEVKDHVFNLSYDEDRGMYYLNPGEGLRFGYTCSTGEAANSEDIANNTIVMPYVDYLNAGTPTVDEENCSIPLTPASGPLTEALPYNDGECYILSSAEVAANGFTVADADTQWLASNVKVVRGDIIPGMTKTAYASYERPNQVEASTDFTENLYAGHVKPDDVVRWELQASNSGDMAITEYTITDTMGSPYVFTGDVSFAIVDVKGEDAIFLQNDGDYLFRIMERRQEGDEIKLDLVNMLGEAITVTLDGEAVSFSNDRFKLRSLDDTSNNYVVEYVTREWSNTYEIAFKKNAEGKEVLELIVKDKKLAIPEQSYVRLRVDTYNAATNRENGVYVNQAVLTPSSQTYDAEEVIQGNNVLDANGENAGVSNSAFINVASSFGTSANKAVTQNGNTASTASTQRWLTINKDNSFTYTLTVDGPNGQAMDQIVIIDSLPQVGDHGAFDKSSSRNSAFQVDFADNINLLVKVNGTQLNTNEYEVSYSSQTDFTNNTSAWEGVIDGTTWTNYKSGDSRSLRVKITGTDKLPSGVRVEIQFDAVVSKIQHSDGNQASPGEIAWNSFGYRYRAGEIDLSAAPLNVGVKVPEAPTLKKEVLKEQKPYPVSQDEEFRLLIYSGAEIEGLAELTNDALNTLSSRNRTVVTLNVAQGSSASDIWQMANPKMYNYNTGSHQWDEWNNTWNWQEGETYHVMELPIDGNYYRFDAWNNQTGSVYSFVYDPDKKVSIKASNEYITWDIVLQKTDAETQKLLLQNAVYGLYRLTEPSAAENAELQNRIDGSILDHNPIRQVVHNDKTYYLIDIATTDGQGVLTWTGLEEDVYLVAELQAPEHYNMDNTPILADRSSLVQQGENYVFATSATNTTAYELPKTGSGGRNLMYFVGAVLMMVGVCLRNKRQRKDTI